MRTDITVEKIIKGGDVKLNKSELARQYGCCWETIDRRLNPNKYVHERKKRIYHSKLDGYKNIIDGYTMNYNLYNINHYCDELVDALSVQKVK